MPKAKSGESVTRTQPPSENGVVIDEKVHFLSSGAAPTVKIQRDGTVIDTSSLKITPASGKSMVTSHSRKRGQNQSTIIGMVKQNIPEPDPYWTIRDWARQLRSIAFSFDQTHPNLAWWDNYPDAVARLVTDEERYVAGDPTQGDLPQYMTVEWLRRMCKRLCKRAAHEIFDAYIMRWRQRATLFNLLQFMGYKGKDRITQFAPEVAFSMCNTVMNNTGKGYLPKGCDDYLLKYTSFIVGENNRMTPIVLFPIWKTDLTGNEWFKSMSAETIMDLNASDSLRVAGRDTAYGTTNKNGQVGDAIFNLSRSLELYVYPRKPATNKAPWKTEQPHGPIVNGLGAGALRAHFKEGEDVKDTLTWADFSNAGHTFSTLSPRMLQKYQNAVHSELMKSLWNAFFWYDEYQMYAHDWLTFEGSDMMRVALLLKYNGDVIFEPAKHDFNAISKALQKDHLPRDLNSFLDAAKYSKDSLNTSTIMKYAPFWYDRTVSTHVDFRTTKVGTDQVFMANFERYEVEDEILDPGTALAKAETWPHLNPSVFSSGISDGKHFHVVNATPTLGAVDSDQRPRTLSGVVRTYKDIVTNIPFDAYHNQASSYVASDNELARRLAPNVDFVVCKDYPINGRVMHQPLLDTSDPVQSGIFLLLSDPNSLDADEWSGFYRLLTSYTGQTNSPKQVSTVEVAGVKYPADPVYQFKPSDTSHTQAKVMDFRRHAVNDDYLRFCEGAFLYVGLNVLFSPRDIFSAPETAHLYSRLGGQEAEHNETMASTFLATNIDSGTLLDAWDACTSPTQVGSDQTGYGKTPVKALTRAMAAYMTDASSGVDLNLNEWRFYVNDPKFGPILWNTELLTSYMSDHQFYPTMEADRGNCTPNTGDIRFALADFNFTSGLDTTGPNPLQSGDLDDDTTYASCQANIGDILRQNDILNTKIFFLSGTLQILEVLGRRTLIADSGDEIHIDFEDHDNYIDFSLGRMDIVNIGGLRSLPHFDEVVLPNDRQPEFVTTHAIPPDFVIVEPRLSTVRVSDGAKTTMGRLRQKPNFKFARDVPEYGAKRGDSWFPDKDRSQHKSFYDKKYKRTPHRSQSGPSGGLPPKVNPIPGFNDDSYKRKSEGGSQQPAGTADTDPTKPDDETKSAKSFDNAKDPTPNV